MGEDDYWIDDQPRQDEPCGITEPHDPHRWFSDDMKYDFDCPGVPNGAARIEEPS